MPFLILKNVFFDKTRLKLRVKKVHFSGFFAKNGQKNSQNLQKKRTQCYVIAGKFRVFPDFFALFFHKKHTFFNKTRLKLKIKIIEKHAFLTKNGHFFDFFGNSVFSKKVFQQNL